MKTYTNLVFKGGGVKGIAYAGALAALDTAGVLPTITRVAGTSAGSIVAALVAVGYTPSAIKSLVSSIDFKSFKDGWDPLRIPTKYGLYKGDAFLNWLDTQLVDKSRGGSFTFARLKEWGMKDLRIVATDISSQSAQVFSWDTTPNVLVSEAVRASMSIPLFFEGFVFSQGMPDKRVYVDGGAVWNYPLTIFPQGETLGLFLYDDSPVKVIQYDNLEQYILALGATVLNAQNIDYQSDPEQVVRTIVIPGLGISATDFDLEDTDKTNLFNSGITAVQKFFAGTI